MTDNYIVALLTTDQAPKLWHLSEPLIAPLLAQEGLYLPAHILANHLKGEMNIWVACAPDQQDIDAAMVTQLNKFPLMTICSVPYIAGKNMHKWAEKFKNDSEAFARANGARRMVGAFRKGWIRVGGYTDAGVILKKDL